MTTKMEYKMFSDILAKNVFGIVSSVFLLSLLWVLVKAYFLRRHFVQEVNKLPTMKLKFYHVLGHVNLAIRHRLMRTPLNISPHVYDFLALIGIQEIFSMENIINLWQIYHPFMCVYKADSVEMILNHSTELKKSWFYELLHPWLGTGLLTSEGDKWKIRRKLLTSAFHFNILKDFYPGFNKQSKIFVNVLKKYTQDEFIDIVPLSARLSFDIICETILGTEMHTQTQPTSPYVKSIVTLTRTLQERLQMPWLWNDFVFKISPQGKLFAENLRIVDNFTAKLISEKKKDKIATRQNHKQENDDDEEEKGQRYGRKNKALMDLLIEEHIKHNSLSEEDIREEVNTFAFEGHDTTSISISWTLYMIGLHPWIQEKLHDELDSIFGADDRDATVEDIKNMKYLECVIKESLRLYSPVPAFGRLIKEDIQFQGRTLPKGSNIIVFPYFLHRNPEVFPNPEKFNPDRFIPENSIGRHPFAYVPFSAGPRNCIGQKFAMMEEKTVLSAILREFKVRSLDPRDRVHLLHEIVMRPADGLRIQIRRRNENFDFKSVYYFQ